MATIRQFLHRAQGYRFDFTLALATNLVVMALGLFTGILTARLLGPSGRGELAAIQLWGLLLLTLGTLGVPEALVYYTGRAPEEVGKLITSAWAVMLPLSLLWILLGLWLLPYLLHNYNDQVVRAAQLFLLILPMAYISRAIMAQQGLRQFFYWGAFRIHKPLIYAVLLVIIGIMGVATPYTLTLALIVSSAVGPFLVSFIIRKSGIRLEAPSYARMRELMSYGMWSVLGSAPEQLNVKLDQFVMVIFLSSRDLGLYVVAVSWSLMIAPLVRTMNTVTFSYVASTRQEKNRLDLFSSSVRMSVLFVLLITLVMLIVTPFLFPLLYGESFQEAVPAALILIVASGFYSLKLVLGGGLRGLGYPQATAYAEITSLVVTLLLLYLLLPALGIVGAALASLLAYFVAVTMLLFFVVHKSPLTLQMILLPTEADLLTLKKVITRPFDSKRLSDSA